MTFCTNLIDAQINMLTFGIKSSIDYSTVSMRCENLDSLGWLIGKLFNLLARVYFIIITSCDFILCY